MNNTVEYIDKNKQPPTGILLPILYAIFAAIATAINIGAQAGTIRTLQHSIGEIALTIPLVITNGYFNFSINILVSIIVATGLGLIVKYYLDKKFIFIYEPTDLKDDSKKFFLYTVMGIATTVIFLSFEYSFEYIFNTETMRYIGATIGLTIGYIVKYLLDKKFVFKT